MIGFFEYQSLQNKKMHLQNLVALAEADGKLHAEEISLLNRIGKHYGLKKNEILEIFKKRKQLELKIPANYDQKVNQLHEIVKLMMADNIIDDEEMKIARNMALKLNFDPDIIERFIESNKQEAMSMWEWEEFKLSLQSLYKGD